MLLALRRCCLAGVRHSDRRVEIGALQISAFKVGIGQVRAHKTRAPDVRGVARGREIGIRQIGAIEDGTLQVRAGEVGAYEVLACEIVVLQVLAGKIVTRARRRRRRRRGWQR